MVGYSFPDTEAALAEVLTDLATTYLHLEYGFESTLPAAHVYTVGGSQSGIFREDRVEVAYYAAGRDAARQLADEATAKLTSGPHYVDGVGLLDTVRVDVPPRTVPYASDTTSQVLVTYRVATRPNPT